jgi:hypothetical protein
MDDTADRVDKPEMDLSLAIVETDDDLRVSNKSSSSHVIGHLSTPRRSLIATDAKMCPFSFTL